MSSLHTEQFHQTIHRLMAERHKEREEEWEADDNKRKLSCRMKINDKNDENVEKFCARRRNWLLNTVYDFRVNATILVKRGFFKLAFVVQKRPTLSRCSIVMKDSGEDGYVYNPLQIEYVEGSAWTSETRFVGGSKDVYILWKNYEQFYCGLIHVSRLYVMCTNGINSGKTYIVEVVARDKDNLLKKMRLTAIIESKKVFFDVSFPTYFPTYCISSRCNLYSLEMQRHWRYMETQAIQCLHRWLEKTQKLRGFFVIFLKLIEEFL